MTQPAPTGIGELNESTMHAQIKNFCATDTAQFEVKLGRYFIDIIDAGELIEIQTRNLGAMKKKLETLLEEHRVRVVYPLIIERWLITHSDEETTRRKSPKRGKLLDIFDELISVPALLANQNFTLDVLLVTAEEHRVVTPPEERKRWRDKGFKRVGKSLIEIQERHLFRSTHDILSLLPQTLPSPFTTKDLATQMKIKRKRAQQIAYCLKKMHATITVGKSGQTILYDFAP